MKIDLKDYGREFAHWIDAFAPFIERTSQRALRQLLDELEDGRDRHQPRFDWKLAKPIRTRNASKYDGPAKSPHEVWISWSFHAAFSLDPGSTRRPLWSVTEMVTHIRVHAADDDSEILHFHHDMKNAKQLGPHVHMQFSEEYLKASKRVAIGVPRFPAAALLPTDCLDFVLAEFFPYEWPKSQSGATGLSNLQASQQKRLLAMARALMEGWADTRKTPLTAIQEITLPDLRIA